MSPDHPSPTLVIVPAWNEAASVGKVVADLCGHDFTVLVVDDGSSDDTARVATDAGASVLVLPINLGVGGALRAGFRYAADHGFRRIVQCDADGQHPPESVNRLLRAADETGAHLLVGSRFASEDAGMRVSFVRRFAMRILAWSASRAVGSPITDASSGFRVISEPLLGHFSRQFPAHYLGDTYEAMISAGRAGYIVREIGIPMRERTHGVSSAGPAAAARLAARAIIVFASGLHIELPRFEGGPGGAKALSSDSGG